MAELFAFHIGEQLLEKVSGVLEKLGPVACREICLAWSVKSDLENLKDTLTTINAVLLDAEEKQAQDHAVRDWLAKLKNAYYDAEDLLDEFEVEALRKQVLKQRSIGRKLCHYFFSSSNPVVFASRMGHRITSIRERFDQVASLKNKFHFRPLAKQDDHRLMPTRETDSSLEPDVVGRDDDKKKIVEMLMRSSDGNIGEDIPDVLPIVGIAGLGKTALAKLVFNDEKIYQHFEMKIWVCVSEDFDGRQLMIKTIKSAADENCSDKNKEQLNQALRRCLGGKRYLLVLDDVWHPAEIREWIKQYLSKDGVNGCKIIVTTRSNQVAATAGTLPRYDLKGISDEESLSLFIKLAFGEGNDPKPKLVEIGMDIVKKCQGLRLSVKTIASQLRHKTAENEWEQVRDNEMWELNQEQGKDIILPALKLSYDQLPSYLRRCFSSCSVFPKDYNISNIQLVSFWVALGMLQSKETEAVEDVGKRYLRELWGRSFFQDFQETLFLMKFKMHDLLHGLALWMAEDECSVVKKSSQNLSATIRHLSIVNSNSFQQDAPKFFNNADRVRTLVFQHMEKSNSGPFLERCFSKCRRLRVLDLGESSFDEMPSTIGDLKHLRYLNISDNVNIKKLPNSVTKLQSLQTLFLAGCKEIIELPRGIRYMISLRMLFISTKQRVLPENEIGCLTSLQYLSISECHNLEYLFQGMQNLTALRTMVILSCPKLLSLPPGMKHLLSLQVLVIWDCEKLTLDMEMEFEGKEYGSLRALAIGQLPKLVAIPQWLLLGSTKNLQQLVIVGCENLIELPEWFQDLTFLEFLKLVVCPKLSSLPDGMQCLISLKQLGIEACPVLSKRCKPETGEDWLKIAHVKRIVLDGIQISPAN